tara:strand:+ start:4544 stop:5656 length:1113 start_codon:yes stop_codon:yes gene_type:complete
VDFIIFSDCQTSYKLPKNVKLTPFTIDEFDLLATKKLGFKINIQYAYKFCDLKPAYGIIFSEYVKDYDFWGMTDIDIIFGRIREFITEDLLSNYDVISVRNDYPTGSFMLFKNTEIINNLFKKSKDYKMVFQSDTHYCFDECNFKHNFLQAGGNIDDIDCEIESMHHVIKKEEANNNLKAHFDFLVIEGLPGQLKWEKGFLSFKNEFEVLLHHLILYKANKYTRKKAWKHVPDTFHIDKYLVRKSELNTVKGFIANTIYNKLIPNFNKLIFKCDYFISHKINMKGKNLEPGNYLLNDLFIKMSNNDANEKTISFNNSKTGNRIRKSVFNKNRFFMLQVPSIKYQIKKEKDVLIEHHINGVTQILKKVPNN